MTERTALPPDQSKLEAMLSCSPANSKHVYPLPGWSISTNKSVPSRLPGIFTPAFERELIRNGVTYLGRLLLGMQPENSPQKGVPAGCIGFFYPFTVRHLRLVAGKSEMFLEKELERINDLGVPVVLHDCGFILEEFPDFNFQPYPNVYPFGRNRSLGGEFAGAYLRGLEHMKVAYFSYSQEPWNFMRCKGVELGMLGSGQSPGDVVPFHANVRKFSVSHYPDFHFDDPPEPLKAITREFLNGYEFQSQRLARKMLSDAFTGMIADHHRTALRPHFAKAYADPDITAWVASDSTVALSALEFFHSKRVPIPDKFSLIGIDDNQILSDEGITGVDLCVDRMAQTAAHCLLGDTTVSRDRQGIVECPLQVVERGSVARV